MGCKMLEGTEPTPHSCILDTMFKGRLDPILFSHPFEVKEEEITVRSVECLMPNTKQLSDHGSMFTQKLTLLRF